jgi:hypothetical protein
MRWVRKDLQGEHREPGRRHFRSREQTDWVGVRAAGSKVEVYLVDEVGDVEAEPAG